MGVRTFVQAYNVVLDGVESRCGLVALEVVANVAGAQDTALFEHPIGERRGEIFVA